MTTMTNPTVHRLVLRRVIDEFATVDDADDKQAELLLRADHVARKVARDVRRLQVGRPRSTT